MPSSRVDYDAIANGYDNQPYRAKSADLELAGFLAERAPAAIRSLLDIACGTGSQLIANRPLAPAARMVGVDGSFGMLRRARVKSAEIGWLHADAAALPLRSGSFDFVSCQYAFHHFADRGRMLREAFRVLCAAGRLVVYNLCPQDMSDWIYYDYFPQSRERDLLDFWPPDKIAATMQSIGFAVVTARREHVRFEHDLADFYETVRRRDNNSQLMVLSDAAYKSGMRRLERELADPAAARIHADHLCFVTIRGDKPANMA